MKYLFFSFLILILIPQLSLADSVYSAHLIDTSSQYFTHADDNNLGIKDGWTVETWFRSTATADDQMIFQKRVDNTDNIGMGVILAGNLMVRINNTDGNSTPTYFSNTTWYYTAIYFNGANSKLYYATSTNSVTVETLNLPTKAVSPAAVFNIGSRGAVAGIYFNGDIDDFRIWNDERTEAEINANKNCELSGTEAGLQGYWKFENNANDTTANANHLTLVNSPTYTTAVPSITGICGGDSGSTVTVTATSTPQQNFEELLSTSYLLVLFLAVVYLIYKLVLK